MASLYTIVLGFCSDIANKGRRPQTERDVRRRVPCQIDRFSWPSYFSFLLNHVGWHNKNTVDTNFQIIQNIFFWAVTKQMWIAKKHSAKKYALFFAIFFKIINHLIFWQRLLEFTESYSERRGNIGQNWHTPIECRDFLLHQFLYDRDKNTYRSQDIIWELFVSNSKNYRPCGLWEDMPQKRKTFGVARVFCFFSAHYCQSRGGRVSRTLTNAFSSAPIPSRILYDKKI